MTPIFMTEGLTDSGYGKCVGEDDKHLKINVYQQGSEKFSGIGFGLGSKINLIKDRQRFDAVYSIDENHWNGQVSLQLKLRDIR
jgi:single-stranded-DNA-specific exonuclease